MNAERFFGMLRARKWTIILTAILVIAFVAAIGIWMPREYRATTALVLDVQGADPISGTIFPAQMLAGYMATQADIIKSRGVAQHVVDSLGLLGQRTHFAEDQENSQSETRELIIDKLLKRLDVEPSHESAVINIGFTAKNPQFAASVANAFAKAYLDTMIELKIKPAAASASWFDTRLQELRDNLEQAQEKLSQYQREHKMIETNERFDIETARLGELSSQWVHAQGQAADSFSRDLALSAVEKKEGYGTETMTEVAGAPVVQGLKVEVARAEAKLAEAQQKFSTRHPKYVQAQAELTTLQERLQSEISKAAALIGNTKLISDERVTQIKAAYTAQKNRVLKIKQIRDQATLLAREVELAQRAYDDASRRRGQTYLESQSTQTGVFILSEATPPTEADGTSLLVKLLIGTALGITLGIITALLRELRDPRLRSDSDIEIYLGVPVLTRLCLRDISETKKNSSLRWKLTRKNHPASTLGFSH